jgi:hypothetical protein
MRVILVGVFSVLAFLSLTAAEEYPPHVSKSYPSTEEGRHKTVAPQWVKASELYLNVAAPRQTIGPAFLNSYTLVGPQETGVGHTIDLSREPWNVPKDAKLAF